MDTLTKIRHIQTRRNRTKMLSEVIWKQYCGLVDILESAANPPDTAAMIALDIESMWNKYAANEDEAHALWIEMEELWAEYEYHKQRNCSCDVKPEDERYLDVDRACPIHGKSEGSDNTLLGQLQEAGLGEGGRF